MVLSRHLIRLPWARASNVGVATEDAVGPGDASFPSAAIEVRRVSKTFGRHRVLHDVSFTVEAGEMVALVGENGAGKSTLVACLAGLLNPDSGTMTVAGAAPAVASSMVGVVWQNLALCDNLDVVANLFLGRERNARGAPMLDELAMQREASRHLRGLGIDLPDLTRLAGQLSGGQRQLVAIARALLAAPRLLILDEPTAALGVQETAAIEALLRRLRSAGVTVMLVTHRMEQVFAVADRVLVLRQGHLTADVATIEVHPDDVAALIAGVPTESAARRQLQQLHSLVDQLSAVDPSASMPLIVSSLSASLGTPRISLHLLDLDTSPPGHLPDPSAAVLRCRATIGLHPALTGSLQRIEVRPDANFTGRVAASGQPVVVEDTRREPELAKVGIAAAWAVPILGSDGLLGVISIYADGPGVPSAEQIELAMLHANLAATTIERERLFLAVSQRNRNLESLRAMLDSLAGPGPVEEGLGVALMPLCNALHATAVGLIDVGPNGPECRMGTTATDATLSEDQRAELTNAASLVLDGPAAFHRARPVGRDSVAVPVAVDDRRAVLAAWWADPSTIAPDTLDLIDDAARSLALAIEREAVEEAHKESEALRRSSQLQREFLHRLSHELRTPLTAIHGYADTLRQPDVAWDAESQQRFLSSIVSESARMRRLVADLLDTSAMEGGGLRIKPDWCDVGLVVASAVACVPTAPEAVSVRVAADLPTVWADHDRLEQVIVNLINNGLHHGKPPVEVTVTEVRADPLDVGSPGHLEIVVADSGDGFAPEIAASAFEPMVRSVPSTGAGLGLTIVRGIVEAHKGHTEIIQHRPGRTEVRVSLPMEP